MKISGFGHGIGWMMTHEGWQHRRRLRAGFAAGQDGNRRMNVLPKVCWDRNVERSAQTGIAHSEWTSCMLVENISTSIRMMTG